MIEFPSVAEVPASMTIDVARWDRQWLCGGEVRQWEGATAPVYSAVWVRGEDGGLAPMELGRVAMVDGAAAEDALAAAKAAWDHGRGPWPTMRVGERIERVETFVAGMRAAREDLVRLLMWEIAKTRADAESEVDRTIAYVVDTIAALKELDRTARALQRDGRLHRQIRRSPLGRRLVHGAVQLPAERDLHDAHPGPGHGQHGRLRSCPSSGAVHLPLLEAFRDAFPPGVVNVCKATAETVVGPIMASGDVDVLAFIGTSRVANLIARQHPRPNRLRCGSRGSRPRTRGDAAVADLDLAVARVRRWARCRSTASAARRSSWSSSTAALPRTFNRRLVIAVDALRPGLPWDPGAQLTPLPETGKPAYLRGTRRRRPRPRRTGCSTPTAAPCTAPSSTRPCCTRWPGGHAGLPRGAVRPRGAGGGLRRRRGTGARDFMGV
jgi:glyceraldehyde-3-phosphate dehydrogenase (NADP+)